jgi:hypothetical protein
MQWFSRLGDWFFEPERWRKMMTAWIALFSLVVIYGGIALRNTQSQGRKDRQEQFAALAQSQLVGCERGNLRWTHLLDFFVDTSKTPDKTATQLAPIRAIVNVDCQAQLGKAGEGVKPTKTTTTTNAGP